LPFNFPKTRSFLKTVNRITNINQQEKTLEVLDSRYFYTVPEVTIWTDSRYAYGCIHDWVYKWIRNGWVTARRRKVANRDLIQKMWELHCKVESKADVLYIPLTREKNQLADRYCNECMNKMEEEQKKTQYDRVYMERGDVGSDESDY
jgi:ribonuclease HI